MSGSLAPRRALSILLADDSQILRHSLVGLLQEHTGTRIVGQASTGAECLKLVGSLRPDVVLLDLTLPDMTGFDVLRSLKAGQYVPHVIVLSLFDDGASRESARLAGADAYLSKSAAGRELLPLLDEIT
ncbi:MAG TPA: response regulator transcription factor [Steroidobacteraceae bacterium]|nr:response regulator transcription factor [Steroidobacteraceae bacterium]